MSDRRPSSPARRPAQGSRPSGSRPAGSRPNPSSASRRPAPRRKRHASGRFYLFLAILVVVIVAVVLLLWKPWATSPDPIQSNSDAANPAATSSAGSSSLGLDLSDDQETDSVVASLDGSGDDVSALSMHLGNEDEQLQGLSDEQLFQVEDLHINPDLPSEWKNVLLLGTDQRSLDESSRSDTMIICSINTTTGEVKLSSIMRDLAVEFDELGEYNGTYRINAANYFGGPEMAMRIVNECFDMNIEDYVLVNFYGFQYMAQMLGGIDITITEAEAIEINRNLLQQARMSVNNGTLTYDEATGTFGGEEEEGILKGTLFYLEEAGDVHLNGRQTLAYARIRKIDSDISRAERQRKVLFTLLEKLKGQSVTDLALLAYSMEPYFETNMNLEEIISIAQTVLSFDFSTLSSDDMNFRLPVNGTYVQETRNEQSMFYDCDWQTNALQLYNFIYE